MSYIKLEKKEKIESRGYKKSCLLTIDEYDKIISGNILELIYDTDKELIKELTRDVLLYNYEPKLIVDYERIAYVEEITNIRITFDMKISCSYEIDHFLDGDYTKYYYQETGFNVLEVKFDDILPSYIRNIIESFNFRQQSFSKYYYGRKIIENFMI